MELFHSWWTALSLALFVGIWVWAFSPRRRNAFHAAERIPLEEDTAGRSHQDHHADER